MTSSHVLGQGSPGLAYEIAQITFKVSQSLQIILLLPDDMIFYFVTS